VIDKAVPLTADAAIDSDRLAAWLATILDTPDLTVKVSRFPSGFSNLTYLIEAGGRELVLRRPPLGVEIAHAHDMGREHGILDKIGRVWDQVPRTLAFCDDPAVIGAPFYVMERVRGIILRDHLPDDLPLTPDTMRRISTDAVDTLAQIHRLDTVAAGLTMGRPEGYAARQVSGWTRRYQRAKTDDIADIEALSAWLGANLPATGGVALIHNDFKYDNLSLDPDDLSVKAVLDWEMATRGDPRMDLGSALAYWVQADDPPELTATRFCLTHLPGNLDRQEVVSRYCEQTDSENFDPVWYYAYGLFKLAVVLQQLYARYQQGHTTEDRYADMVSGVRGLSAVALRAIARGRIVDLG
jgi:aminoglycoside phosphotransferase (APT) family kinase protein